ncbi:hypothetical protein STCU_11426 [Strigomonas culicis]|uniref:Uncharacterized protein n=1 Tax=Strigomonas culicis TaxID=28005 RepID=S9TH85_9TRYP|nr:hypothetical protein STCU_11426 [Strigomonas culicis]|eukprot:EPY16284.1 hypothetical protein STCU_11426 [Strigomonas culicis]
MDDLAVETLLRDLQGAATSGATARIVGDLIRTVREQARRDGRRQQEELEALRRRVDALERRRECHCGGAGAATASPAGSVPPAAAQLNSPGPHVRSNSLSAANTSLHYFSSPGHAAPEHAGGAPSSLPASAIAYRSSSRMSEQDAQRCVTPLVRPERGPGGYAARGRAGQRRAGRAPAGGHATAALRERR